MRSEKTGSVLRAINKMPEMVCVPLATGNNQSKLASQQPGQTLTQPREIHEPAETDVQVEMVNVDVHLDPVLILHLAL